nr:60S ribosomal protein L22-2-like [Tanacetum cinerariifolium]
LRFFNYALILRQDYDITSSLRRGALHVIWRDPEAKMSPAGVAKCGKNKVSTFVIDCGKPVEDKTIKIDCGICDTFISLKFGINWYAIVDLIL